MYKVIAADVDGTLLNSEKKITDATLSALLNAQEKGAKFVIATGRPPYGVRDIAKQLQLDRFRGYIIGCNGAVVVSAKDPNTPLFEAQFPLECIKPACKVIKNRQVSISSYEGNCIVVGNFLTNYILRNANMLGMPYKFVENFPEYTTFPVHKCLLSGRPDEIKELEDLFSKQFASELSVFRSESFLLEMVRNGVNKGTALKFITAALGAQQSECIAFGDNDNDISMLSYAGTGVAMDNASETVKSAANIVAPSNDDDGIAKVIKFLQF